MRHRFVVAFALMITACSSTASSPPPASTPATAPEPARAASAAPGTIASEPARPSVPSDADSCPVEGTPQPWDETMITTLETILEADGLRVDAAVYPRPDYRGKPWSQWGQGIVLDDGRFLSAIGDHHGIDGNSFLYEYDAATNELALFADLGAVLDHEPGSWGYGKVHAQMVEGPCGVYVASYWGTRRSLSFDDHYRGDHLLLVDPIAESVTDLGLVVPLHGVPSMASDPARGLIFAEAVDPMVTPKDGPFAVLDQNGTEVFRSDVAHDGYRAMAVDAGGRVYFSGGNGRLNRYDPDSNSVEELGRVLPGDVIRAATAPAPDGTVYAVTREPAQFISISPDGHVTPLASARGYTASLALGPAGDTLYYVPHAHGGSAREGTPLLAVDTATGEEREVVLLNAASEAMLGLTLGGTYNIAVNDRGDTIFLGMNAGPTGSGHTFGEVVLLVIRLES